MRVNRYFLVVLAAVFAAATAAQEPNPTQTAPADAQQEQPAAMDQVPLYRIQVVQREIVAVNYLHRKGSTMIAFRGTALLPDARGSARVDAQGGRTEITLDVEGMTPANGFGAEYLTYVLWAITPEGRPANLGEMLPTGGKDEVKTKVTTDLQAFGLVITAEPYFAVTEPSDLVVMQNEVEDRTRGVIEQVNAHYTLLPRGAYAETAGRHAVLHPIGRSGHSPLELYEAQNAMEIAQVAGADHYATDSFATAQTALVNAEGADRNRDRKMTITFAREAVQGAEDARLITIRKIKAEDEANEARARQAAEQDAEQQRAAAQQAAEQRAQAEAQAQQEAAQRAQAEAAAQEAQAREQQAAAARATAEAQAAQAREQQQQAEQAAAAAAQQAAQMRERLRQQLNQVLETQETARGLIVNMPNVLFAFNKYDLKPEAREKLAKVSGILLAYPDLKVQVEGYTDIIGSDEYNQKLSEERAGTVRDYLVDQNVQSGNISAEGYGKSHPIADNSTSEGRAQNRRVQLVVSGNAIGVPESQPGAGGGTQPAGQPGMEPNAAPQGQPGNAPQPQNPQGTADVPQGR